MRLGSLIRCSVPLAALIAFAVGAFASANPARAAGLLVADGGFGGLLEIKEHAARVTINNGVAVTEVDQVFVNKEKRIVEALYVFPVPKGASVSNFTMIINGKEMVGEVVEKERARQIYESYKQKRRDPGLLEQVDYKTFELRIFPIPAEAEQRIHITYCQELDFDHDAATYVYPLATNALKRGVNERTTGRFALTLDVKSEIPLTELRSPSHADDFAVVKHADDHYWQASLEATGGDLSRDVVVSFHVERPRTGLDVITSRPHGEDGYFLLTLTAGKELEAVAQGADYVFLLDVSGSMERDGKLVLSRKSIDAFVEKLGPQDRVELITFNVGADTLFGSLKPADDAAKTAARTYLASQRARGGTVLRPAVEAAYRYLDKDRPLNVIIISDGMTEQSEQRQLIDLIGRRPAGTTVFCVGVGNDVNRPLLTQLANDAGGLAAFLSAGDDFERQAEAFRRKLSKPSATNVRLAFDGGDVYDVEPQRLPNLFHGQPLRVYGRYRKPGAVQVRVQAEIQGSTLDQVVPVELPRADDANPQIERMWAWKKVERLNEEMRRDGSLGLRDEVVRLCEGYSIVSEYASFIVLENDAEYDRWKIERRNVVRSQRDRLAQQELRNRLEQMQQQTQAAIGPNADPTAAADRPKAQNAAASPVAPQGPAVPDRDSRQSANRDLNFPSFGGGGGGAIDPLSAGAILSLVGAGLWRRKRRAA
jgi:Ca-activated chloride channel family protein